MFKKIYLDKISFERKTVIDKKKTGFQNVFFVTYKFISKR